MLVFGFVVAFDLPIAYFPLVNISAVSKVVARPLPSLRCEYWRVSQFRLPAQDYHGMRRTLRPS